MNGSQKFGSVKVRSGTAYPTNSADTVHFSIPGTHQLFDYFNNIFAVGNSAFIEKQMSSGRDHQGTQLLGFVTMSHAKFPCKLI